MSIGDQQWIFIVQLSGATPNYTSWHKEVFLRLWQLTFNGK